MSREIKFRGKTNTGKWIIGCLVYSVNIQPAIYFEVGEGNVKSFDWAYVMPESVGEFTNKKDCNGKEIFEGDIIEFDKREWCGDDNIHVVSWNNENAEWSWGGGNTSDMEWRTVIGNIYDNPELLSE